MVDASSSCSSSQNAQIHTRLSSVEVEATVGFRSPLTPALCKEAEGNPWKGIKINQTELSDSERFDLTEKDLSAHAEGGKENLAVDLCDIEEGEVAQEEEGGGEGEGEAEKERSTDVLVEEMEEQEKKDRSEDLVQVNGRFPSEKESISLSDLARNVRLRVKRVRRSAKPNLLEKRAIVSDECKEIRVSKADNIQQKINQKSSIGTNRNDILEEQVAGLEEIRVSEPEKELDQKSLKTSFSNGEFSINGIHETSPTVRESSYLSSIQDQSTSSMLIPLSLKEKILRKSSQSRAKYVENAIESRKTDQSNNRYVETIVNNKLPESYYTKFPVSGSSRSTESLTDQCISQAARLGKHNALGTMMDHMNDNRLTENNARKQLDASHSSEDYLERQHRSLFVDEDKIRNPEDDEGSCRVYTREDTFLHHRSQDRTSGLPAHLHNAFTYDTPRQCIREKALSETEIRDEPPGFGLAEAQVRNYDRLPNVANNIEGPENTVERYCGRVRHFGSRSGLANQNADNSELTQGQCFGRFQPGNSFNHVSQTGPGRRNYFLDNVPSAPCDEGGIMCNTGKSSEHGKGSEGAQLSCQYIGPEGRSIKNNRSPYADQWNKPHEYAMSYDNQYNEPCEDDIAYGNQDYGAQDYSMGFQSRRNEAQIFASDYGNQHHNVHEYEMSHHNQHNQTQEYGLLSPNPGCTPFNDLIQLNWKWSSDVGSAISNNRIKIVKERSIFVGCIPDGIQNLDSLLRNLMEQFLGRFDFAPIRLGQVQVIKTVKDFAFIELAADKVAQIVLSVNQLDVFEWGVNGYHFNIQGCTATYTSVRPMIEYMPLRPARVIFVGNIPKFRWQQEYLEGYFTKILQGSDGPADFKYVSCVYLLPESSDAYVEMTSELMADALLFKCTKIPEFLREIGPDVFICRDMRSVPLMSRHKGTICPQRSLYIEVTPGGVEFKINSVMDVFGEILPYIARNSNQRGYLEYVNVQPGKDYAFLQFNTESFVDAIMDEYVENTQIFVCKDSNVSYTILRAPGYVRPGALYGLEILNPHSNLAEATDTERSRREKNDSLDPSINIGFTLRRFGDEPTKKPDCIISIGASPVPLATWNEPSTGWCSAEPDCMIVIDGLPKGYSCKLIHGTLNELFERSLCQTGLLEVGILVVRYFDYDGSFGVATLPNSAFVTALLSISDLFVVAGEEVRLLPYDTRSFQLKANPVDFSVGHCELSSLSDEDSQGRTVQNSGEHNPELLRHSDQGYVEIDRTCTPGYDTVNRRFNRENGNDEWCQSETWSASSPNRHRGFRNWESSHWDDGKPQRQRWKTHVNSVKPFRKTSEERYCEGNNPRIKVPHIQKGGSLPYNNSVRGQEIGSRIRKKCADEGFQIVSREGCSRMNQQVCSPSISEKERLVEMGRKRRPSDIVQGIPVYMNELNHRKMRHPHSQFP